MARRPRSLVYDLIYPLLGLQNPKDKKLLDALNRLAGDELGYAGLELSPDQRSYQNKTRVPFFDKSELTPKYTLDQEMMALAGGPQVDYGAMQLNPEQTQQAINSGWAKDKSAPLSEDQEHSRRMLRYLSAVKDIDLEGAAGIASEFFNPVARKDRVSKRAYRDAATEQIMANLAGGGEDGLSWPEYLKADPRVQALHDRFSGLNSPRIPQMIRLLDRRKEAEAMGDTDEVSRIDGIIRELIKIETGAGSTGVLDVGTKELEQITTPDQMIAAETDLAEETAAAKQRGKAGAESKFNWGSTKILGDHAVARIDELIGNDEALRWATGFFGPAASVIPGTPGYVGGELMDSIKGHAFLTAAANNEGDLYPISDADARSLKASITALGTGLPYEQAKKELKNIRRLTRNLLVAMGKKAGVDSSEYEEYMRDLVPTYDRQGNRLN